VLVLLALAFGWDISAQRAARRLAAEEEASAEQDVGAFPVPPMDLPHYHGLAAGAPGLKDQAPDSGVKEVTGA